MSIEINPRHILWLRTDSIGDNILAASMLHYVKEAFPLARITVLCQEHIAELYAPCPYIDGVVTILTEHQWRSTDDIW